MAEPASSTESGAVFLSYCSQDAAPARALCEALRGAGIEVWFDQSELRGGDAWDGKIRRQIRDCALFLPLISDNTQRRKEGYFRLEWRLADQRTFLMGRDKAFLVPVCVDDLSDVDADVPDSFTAVQWTRLRGGETTPALVERVRGLLAGQSILGSAVSGTHRSVPAPRAPLARESAVGRKWTVAVAAVVVCAAAAIWWVHRPAQSTTPPTDSSASNPALPPQAAEDIAKTRGLLANINYGQADLALAENFMAQATAAAEGSSETWGLRGLVQATYVLRNWDQSETRLRDAETSCKKALALNKDNVEAMLAWSIILQHQGANAQGEALMRAAIRLKPDDPQLPRSLARCVFNAGEHQRALKMLEENARRFDRDPMSWYDLALQCDLDGDLPRALDAYRHVVALFPVATAYVAIAKILAIRGDLAGADAALQQIPIENRTDERPVGVTMWLGLLEHHPDRVIAAAANTSTTYFGDIVYRGPKATMVALAYMMAGKPALAAREWDEAIQVLRARQGPQMTDEDRINLATALAWRGQKEEAGKIAAAVEPVVREEGGPLLAKHLAMYHAALGDPVGTVAWLRQTGGQSLASTPASGPWWAKVHDAPEFQAFVREKSQL